MLIVVMILAALACLVALDSSPVDRDE